MPPQEPIRVFGPKVRVAFEPNLNKERASARTFLNATKRSYYFHFCSN